MLRFWDHSTRVRFDMDFKGLKLKGPKELKGPKGPKTSPHKAPHKPRKRLLLQFPRSWDVTQAHVSRMCNVTVCCSIAAQATFAHRKRCVQLEPRTTSEYVPWAGLWDFVCRPSWCRISGERAPHHREVIGGVGGHVVQSRSDARSPSLLTTGAYCSSR